jgi:hypothetical protein
MNLPKLATKLPVSTFADYDRAAPAVRTALGVARLSPKLAVLVREAVAKHVEREARKATPTAPGVIARLRKQLAAEVSELTTPITSKLYRHKGAEDDRIAIGPDPRAATSAPTEMVGAWGSGRGFGHVVTSTTFNITVMPSWRRRVLARGMATLDGMFTTHAYPVLAEGEITVYRAAWIRQRAGFNIAPETGFLAFHAPSGTAYHATDSTPEKALANLRRKLKAQAIPADVRAGKRAEADRKRAERRAAQLNRLAGQLSRLDIAEVGHVRIARQDSLKAGNCTPGTDEFIERFFPDRDPRHDTATIAEIAQAVGAVDVRSLAGADLTLARQVAAACLHAIRKDKQARRVLDRELVGVS